MPPLDPETVTLLLDRSALGAPDADQTLSTAIYSELHRIASHLMAQERPDHTLQPTALVHEAYLRLTDTSEPDTARHDRFLILAATVMRHILVDHARGRKRLKRGGGAVRVPLEAAEDQKPDITPDTDILGIHEALAQLEQIDPRKARLVELRFFGGLDEAHAARLLGISRATASNDWRFARAWLAQRLAEQAPDAV